MVSETGETDVRNGWVVRLARLNSYSDTRGEKEKSRMILKYLHQMIDWQNGAAISLDGDIEGRVRLSRP